MAVGPQLQALLSRYGLGSLVSWASSMIINNASEDEIVLALYERPEFKRAFPELEARLKLNKHHNMTLTPLSAEDVLEYRAGAKAILKSYGAPASLYIGDAAFFDLIVNDVSLDELNARVEAVDSRVRQAPPEVREKFDEWFGTAAGDTALFSMALDVQRSMPSLENLIQRAEFGGAGKRMGFDVSQAMAARMDKENLDYGQALEGFTLLDATRSLFEESIAEEVEDFSWEEEGIEAIFNTGPGGKEKLNKRAEERYSSTQGKGGGQTEDRGATGLGGAGQR